MDSCRVLSVLCALQKGRFETRHTHAEITSYRVCAIGMLSTRLSSIFTFIIICQDINYGEIYLHLPIEENSKIKA